MIKSVMTEARVPMGVWQALKFLVVGVLNTALDAGVYLVLAHWVGVWPVVAKAISYGIGVLNSFCWNRSWTFKSDAGAVTLVPFALANLILLVVNAWTIHLCLNMIHLNEILSFVLATGVTFLWNFTVSKFLIFRK